jgi:ABC-2 type transport system ATP-binding protein
MTKLASISGLIIRFGRRTALDDVDLQISDYAGVIGLPERNGAGKSTLIRVICGLINRHRGVVTRSSRIVYLPDAPMWYPWLLLSACIALGTKLWPDFDPARAHALLERLRLDESLRVRELSKGMSEQVHIALTLARRCDLYVFDEPLAAVDPLTRDRVIELIRSECQSGSTVIISTHLIAGLEALFDTAIVIDGGRVLLHAETSDIASHGSLEAQIKEVLA